MGSKKNAQKRKRKEERAMEADKAEYLRERDPPGARWSTQNKNEQQAHELELKVQNKRKKMENTVENESSEDSESEWETDEDESIYEDGSVKMQRPVGSWILSFALLQAYITDIVVCKVNYYLKFITYNCGKIVAIHIEGVGILKKQSLTSADE